MQGGRRIGSAVRGTTAAVGVCAALALVTGCSLLPSGGPERDADGGVTGEPETDAFSVAVGDCIDDPGTEDVTDITVVPCDRLHDYEAIASTRMPDGDYPGEAAASTAATEFCSAEFETFVGIDFESSVLELLYFYPVEESWNAAGDREILCFVAEADEAPVAGTLKDAGR